MRLRWEIPDLIRSIRGRKLYSWLLFLKNDVYVVSEVMGKLAYEFYLLAFSVFGFIINK